MRAPKAREKFLGSFSMPKPWEKIRVHIFQLEFFFYFFILSFLGYRPIGRNLMSCVFVRHPSVCPSVRPSVYRCNSKTAWWIFFKFGEMIIIGNTHGRFFLIFIESFLIYLWPILGQNRQFSVFEAKILKNCLITFFLFAVNWHEVLKMAYFDLK